MNKIIEKLFVPKDSVNTNFGIKSTLEVTDKRKCAIFSVICWMVIVLLLFLAVVPSTSASFFGSLGKTNTCSMLNLTDIDCNILWCQEVIECDYDLIREACICTEINEVNTVNNQSYYNKTDLDVLLNEMELRMNGKIVNMSRVSKVNFSMSNETKDYVDEKIMNLTFAVDSKIFNIETDAKENNESDFNFDAVWIIGIFVVLALAYLLFKNKGKQQEKSSFEKGEARTAHKKIQSTQELSKDSEIEDLKKQIKEKEAKEAVKKSTEEKPGEKPEK